MLSPFHILLTFLAVKFSSGALLTDPAQVNTTTYDYVIIGAGIGGCVTAGRLAEDPKLRILLVEAGGSNEGILGVEVPFLATTTAPTPALNWGYVTSPQAGLNNRTINIIQGRLLGGGSSTNYLVYTRGPSDDYDYMAKVTGDSSWSFKRMLPYIKKHEKWAQPQDGHDTDGQFDPQYHGFNGAVKVSLSNYPTSIDERVLQTVGSVPGFDYVEDMNSGKPLGFGWAQSTIGGGSRSSAATAYLRGQPNLDVLIQTTATRLIQSGKRNGVPYFNSVELAANATSPRSVVKARKEVVVATGGVGTPRLLMLSGIGPRSYLTGLGIPTIVDSKNVGQNLQDHATLGFPFEVNSTYTQQDIAANLSSLLPEWEATKTGPLSNGITNHIGWARLARNDSYLKSHPDPTPGLNTPHMEFILANGILGPITPRPGARYLTITTTVSSPTSRGSVTLNTTNPFINPIINPAFLTTEADIHVMVEAAKEARRFLSGPAWADYVIAPHEMAANLDFSNDASIISYARNYTRSQQHPTCTAGMSSNSSPNGVVGPKLCVKGAAGIRIVDGSVLPRLPAAHPQAVIYAIAEKAADMIKEGSC